MVGTPDYMAPEQALKSSEADVRADLYSLGCTFYFALTGRVAFPGGTLMEKLLKHKMDTATPIESVRREVPKALGDIFRKLMMKKATDRYQTPAEWWPLSMPVRAPRTVRVSMDMLQAGITAIGAPATAEEGKHRLAVRQPAAWLRAPPSPADAHPRTLIVAVVVLLVLI